MKMFDYFFRLIAEEEEHTVEKQHEFDDDLGVCYLESATDEK